MAKNIIKIACLLFIGCLISNYIKAESGVKIVKKNGKFELHVDGVKKYIKGVGGTNKVDLAAKNGANAFRTWGGNIQSINRDLELARANNMYIMQGIGLTKNRTSYSDETYKNKLRDEVRLLAETFKDDPNILVWGIGNEIDHQESADVKEAWLFVDELAQLIKSIDKRHMVSTVITHNPRALDSIAKYTSHLDMVGINSYGAIVGVAKMVDKSIYKGAYMITEWGPSGFWEMPSTKWKAPIEQTSEEKRKVYEDRYNNYILGSNRCLGSFVFLWGQKEERTPTWFSMFVENSVEGLPLKGEKTPMVEAMERVWNNGAKLDQTAPVIESFTLNGETPKDNVTLAAGQSFEGNVAATDKEGDKLTYVWEILKEATVLGSGGSREPRPDRIGEAVTTTKNSYRPTISEPGNYRLYVYVLDNTGFAATANVPFQVIK